ncbi:hypothetical protein L1887_31959 [Cichorium endivia]|nr:hypothetical protein L1887_31959 [Cichorium endivia]
MSSKSAFNITANTKSEFSASLQQRKSDFNKKSSGVGGYPESSSDIGGEPEIRRKAEDTSDAGKQTASVWSPFPTTVENVGDEMQLGHRSMNLPQFPVSRSHKRPTEQNLFGIVQCGLDPVLRFVKNTQGPTFIALLLKMLRVLNFFLITIYTT